MRVRARAGEGVSQPQIRPPLALRGLEGAITVLPGQAIGGSQRVNCTLELAFEVCEGLHDAPSPQVYVDIPAPDTPECDFTWKRCLYKGSRVKTRPLGWALLQNDWCPQEKGTLDPRTDTHRGRVVWRRMGAGGGETAVRPEGCQGDGKGFSRGSVRGGAPPHPDLGFLASRTVR